MPERSFGPNKDPLAYAEGRGGPKTFLPESMKYGKPKAGPPDPYAIPEDIKGQAIIDLMDFVKRRGSPFSAVQNAGGTSWTLDNGTVLSQAAYDYMKTMGYIKQSNPYEMRYR
jgi:hypothetical protein